MKKKGKRDTKKAVQKIFFYIWLLLHIVAALLLLSMLLGTILSPERMVVLAYAGLAFPFIIGFIAVLFVFNLVRWNKKMLLFDTILLLVAAPSCFTYMPIHSKTKVLPEEAIKILSFNVMAFDHRGHTSDKPHPSLSYIRESKADIVCLQEALLSKSGSKRITAETLRSYLPEYPYIDHRAVQRGGSQLVLLSKYPIENVRRLPLVSKFNGAVAYTLRIGEKRLELFNVHLEASGVTARDGIEYVTLAKEGKAMKLTKLVDFKLGPAFVRRARQADRLTLEIASVKTPYTIVCGDFNDTPISYARHRILKNMRDAYRNTGRGPGYSFVFKHYGLRIDHILHSKAIKSYNCTVGPLTKTSDHAPIFCFFTLDSIALAQ